MLKKLMKIVFGDKQARDMKWIMPIVDEINEVAAEYEKLSDDELKGKTAEFRRMIGAVPRVTRVGETVITHELAEIFLRRHPDVNRALFMGTRRDFHPAELVCFVILKEGVTPSDDLATQIREGMGRMSPDHRPAHVLFVDRYPMLKDHKIDYDLIMRVIEAGDIPSWGTYKWDELAKKAQPRKDEGITLDDLIPEAFAAVKEACRRHVGKTWMAAGGEIKWQMVPYDVQLAGAIALHKGNIAEMATGEGKTLVATMPLYLNALSGRGAHLVTVNDYLARRDSEWNAPIFEFLGLSVGCIDKTQSHTPERRAVYNSDIVYGTNNEFGFDYLRDNMALDRMQLVQREHAYAIIDEVDSVLIDEARTPLIIAGPVDRSNQQYEQLLAPVREIVSKQQMLVSRLAKEAADLLDEDPDSWEAGVRLLQCYKGMPKHNRYMKLREDPANQKLQDRVERELMLEKRIRELEEELYFTVDERNRQLDLTEKGRLTLSPDDPEYFVLPDLVDQLALIDQNPDLSPEEKEKEKIAVRENYETKAQTLHSISQLLHAFTLKRRDVEYVVEDGKVVIVDENTGRKMPGRRWSDGLHGAVEAKENVKIEKETQTLATITIQNYFRQYSKLAGMTGTAETEASEFNHTYKMDVIVVPTNVPVVRKDFDDVVYRTKREKYAAVLEEIERLHAMGLPILVGTTTVATSETISRMLRTKRLKHEVLNAKNHAKEAEIVAAAGQPGAITIATNMAGRGTDIKLGEGVRETRKDPSTNEDWMGGLQIIGTERHESRRIDRQLRGRAGRQGDPGTSRFFVSLEDDLMLWFGSERMSTWLQRLGLEEGEPIVHSLVTRAIGNAQKKVEGINQERRKRTLEYDDVMNKQRETIYKLRREILVEEDLYDVMLDVFADALTGVFENEFGNPRDTNSWDLDGFVDWLARTIITGDFSAMRGKRFADFDSLVEEAMTHVVQATKAKRDTLGDEMFTALARHITLRTLDAEWQDHLLAIDSLREGIGLRGYGQKDPLVEFTKDATDMFSEMLLTMHREVLDRFFRAQLVTEDEQRRRAAETAARARLQAQKAQVLSAAQAIQSGGEAPPPEAEDTGKPRKPPTGLPTFRRDMPKVGRNEPCPCGSGKKYKDCHGAPGLRESRSHNIQPPEPPEE
ncbi:MAG: preprotein translocase subunit SecA [Candidatus Sumerlaeota bacterium]|nr:preprotein translocase subunit SecA [Candidatus Sumerlaeota bacterium]